MKTWSEHIMNINWKVRLKSGPFWLGVEMCIRDRQSRIPLRRQEGGLSNISLRKQESF